MYELLTGNLSAVISRALIGGQFENGYTSAGYIYNSDSSGSDWNFCSLVYIKEDVILTAAHCLDNLRNLYPHTGLHQDNFTQGALSVSGNFKMPGYGGFGVNDLAVITIGSNPGTAFASLGTPTIGCNYYVVAYGLNSSGQAGEVGDRKGSDLCIDSITDQTFNFTVLNNADICGGDSGSGIYRKGTEEIVGITSGRFFGATDRCEDNSSALAMRVDYEAAIDFIGPFVGIVPANNECGQPCGQLSSCSNPDNVCYLANNQTNQTMCIYQQCLDPFDGGVSDRCYDYCTPKPQVGPTGVNPTFPPLPTASNLCTQQNVGLNFTAQNGTTYNSGASNVPFSNPVQFRGSNCTASGGNWNLGITVNGLANTQSVVFSIQNANTNPGVTSSFVDSEIIANGHGGPYNNLFMWCYQGNTFCGPIHLTRDLSSVTPTTNLPTPTRTPTLNPSISITPTRTPTLNPSISVTPTHTLNPSFSVTPTQQGGQTPTPTTQPPPNCPHMYSTLGSTDGFTQLNPNPVIVRNIGNLTFNVTNASVSCFEGLPGDGIQDLGTNSRVTFAGPGVNRSSDTGTTFNNAVNLSQEGIYVVRCFASNNIDICSEDTFTIDFDGVIPTLTPTNPIGTSPTATPSGGVINTVTPTSTLTINPTPTTQQQATSTPRPPTIGAATPTTGSGGGGSQSSPTPTIDVDNDNDGDPNDTDPDIDGDGIPNETDTDIDGDGILNNQDPMPRGFSLSDLPDTSLDGSSLKFIAAFFFILAGVIIQLSIGVYKKQKT